MYSGGGRDVSLPQGETMHKWVGLVFAFAVACGDGELGVSVHALQYDAPQANVLVSLPSYFKQISKGVGGAKEIATFGDDVFISYPGNLCSPANPCPYIFASRYNSTSGWSHSNAVLPSIGDLDSSHEDTAIRVDSDGRIHLWGGMHHTPMRYRRSANSDPNSSWTGLNLSSVASDAYTYPESAVSPVNGDVFHISRVTVGGAASRADLFHYRRSSQSWTRVGTVFSGEASLGQEGGNSYIPYSPDLVVDSVGDVHIICLWAPPGGAPGVPAIGRHQGTYVRYDPNAGGFYKADGTLVTSLPITTLQSDSVWQWQPRLLDWSEKEIVSMRVTVGAADRPIVGYNYTPVAGVDPYQHRVATWTGAEWQGATLDEHAGLFSPIEIQSSGGVVRTYVRDETTFLVRAYQSHYDGLLWDRGSDLWGGHLRSTYNRDTSSDVVLDDDDIYEVDFNLPFTPFPTKVEVEPAADSYVRAGVYASANFGSAPGVLVKNYLPTNDNTRMTYIKFDLFGLGLFNIDRARLRLRARALYFTPLTVTAYRVLDNSWQENSITWNNSPYLSSVGKTLRRVHVGDASEEYVWDVTDLVAEALNSPEKVVSIALWVEDGSTNTAVEFYSKEGGVPPVLEIDNFPSNGAQELTLTPDEDAYGQSGAYADTSFGTADDLLVKRVTTADGLGMDCADAPTVASNYARISYLKFALGSVPEPVNRATLRVYNSQVGAASGSAVNTVTAFRMANDSWTESITWNDAPPCSLGAGLDSQSAKNSSPRYLEFDVTAYVNEERAADGFASFALYRSGVASSNVIFFDSRDAGTSRPPELVLTY